METIALMGPYDPEIKALITRLAPNNFVIKEVPTSRDLHDVTDSNYIILRVLSLKEDLISTIPNLKLIQRWGVGYDKVDIKAAGARNIPVAITPGMNASSVSEMAVLHMLAVYRRLLTLHSNVLQGKWQDEGIASKSYTIDGKCVGLIGMGSIGKQVSQKVQAFGATVQYYDVFRLPAEEEKMLGVKYAGLEELLKTSDIISLHVPLNDDTKHLIHRDTIKLMKPSAVIINTARGAIIKEDDLIEALQNNQLLGAGLDCLENEPAEKNNPLFHLPNVVITPHMGGSTMDISVNMARRCMENIIKISQGKSLPATDIVNAEYLSSR